MKKVINMKIIVYGNYVFSVYVNDDIFICEYDFKYNLWSIDIYEDKKRYCIGVFDTRLDCIRFLRRCGGIKV